MKLDPVDDYLRISKEERDMLVNLLRDGLDTLRDYPAQAHGTIGAVIQGLLTLLPEGQK